ncbi:MAG: class I mannose-6-phosphate isomerase [Prevotella sp.]|nr:class I mannose-6-phosphate isomerase [Prevotella sp.]
MLYPLLFQPNLHTVVWGGSRLTAWKQLPAAAAPVGESWEVSAVPSSPSVVANGPWQGRLLPDVVAEHPAEILGKAVAARYGNKLPLLVKFIDAERDLSIQVHPDDVMAQREHGKMGKTEMWYVIDAKPGAFLYAGFKDSLSPDDYRRRVADGTITDTLARHEVHPGDVFYIPAGRVHAICGGIMLAEVQQSSDVTYRIFDYNRPGMDGKPRELHTDLAAKALDFNVYDRYKTEYKEYTDRANRCIDAPFFSVRVVNVEGSFHRNLMKYDSFIITLCVKGDCRLRIRKRPADSPENSATGAVSAVPSPHEVLLREGWSCLIPAAIADYDVIPTSGRAQLLDAFIDNKNRSLLNRFTRFLHITNQ